MGYNTIIAYVYEAEVHCPPCTIKRFGVKNPEIAHEGELDRNNIPYYSTDNEGNRIGVDFEGTEVDYHPGCGDCCEPIHNFSIIHYDDWAKDGNCNCDECSPCEECWQ